jgi:hypothetical protein
MSHANVSTFSEIVEDSLNNENDTQSGEDSMNTEDGEDSMNTEDGEDLADIMSLPHGRAPLDIDLNVRADCGFDLNKFPDEEDDSSMKMKSKGKLGNY